MSICSDGQGHGRPLRHFATSSISNVRYLLYTIRRQEDISNFLSGKGSSDSASNAKFYIHFSTKHSDS